MKLLNIYEKGLKFLISRKILLILLIFIIGCQVGEQAQISEPITVASIDKISLTTDKELYHSGEMIHVDVNVNSEIVLNNASVRIYGIHASKNRLDKTRAIDLAVGENNVVLDYKAPACYGCAGIKPGTYQISADVIYNEEVLGSATIDIEIRQ